MPNILQLCFWGAVSLAITGCAATSQEKHEKIARLQKESASSIGENITPEQIHISDYEEGDPMGRNTRNWIASTNSYKCYQDSTDKLVTCGKLR